MKTKIKSYVQILIIIVILVLSFSLLKSISKILGSNQKIVDEEVRVANLKKENNDLQSELQYVQSPQFIEGEARNKLGLAKNGEIVVVLPDVNTLKSLAPKLPVEKTSLPDPTWKKWLKLFL